MSNNIIALIPLDYDENNFLLKLAAVLEKVFHATIRLEAPIPIPHNAWMFHRNQYNAAIILKNLHSMKKNADKVLAIIDRDIYADGLNFVFGQANPVSKIAIISLARLREEFYGGPRNERVFFLRSLKEAVHELGHLYNLPHCPEPRCVMHFSNSLKDTDNKDYTLCEQCHLLFNRKSDCL
jgi:archaemetzincin